MLTIRSQFHSTGLAPGNYGIAAWTELEPDAELAQILKMAPQSLWRGAKVSNAPQATSFPTPTTNSAPR
jgi:hypothetical protein